MGVFRKTDAMLEVCDEWRETESDAFIRASDSTRFTFVSNFGRGGVRENLEADENHGFTGIVGDSVALREVSALIRTVAPTIRLLSSKKKPVRYRC
jgi:hypothetical protein